MYLCEYAYGEMFIINYTYINREYITDTFLDGISNKIFKYLSKE